MIISIARVCFCLFVIYPKWLLLCYPRGFAMCPLILLWYKQLFWSPEDPTDTPTDTSIYRGKDHNQSRCDHDRWQTDTQRGRDLDSASAIFSGGRKVAGKTRKERHWWWCSRLSPLDACYRFVIRAQLQETNKTVSIYFLNHVVPAQVQRAV